MQSKSVTPYFPAIHLLKRYPGFSVFLGVGIAAALFSSFAIAEHSASPYRLLPALYISKDEIRAGDIGGFAAIEGRPLVHGWVIAEATGLEKPFRELVFTDSKGKFVFRDLPRATYHLSVSGYNLSQSQPIQADLGQNVVLRAVAARKSDAATWGAQWDAFISSPIDIVTLQRDESPYPEFVKSPADGRYVFTWLPAPSSPDEPIATNFSMSRSLKFIDNVNVAWIRKEGCVTCHTTFQYLIGRPLLGEADSNAATEVRKFAEDQVQTSRGRSLFNTIPLALNDAAAGNVLSPVVRSALDTLLDKQPVGGGWHGANTFTPPYEDGDFYPNVMAAVAIGNAPEHYAAAAKGAAGMAKLAQYLKTAPPQNLHNRALLLWASVSTPTLMNEADRSATVKELLSRQRADGGWSLASLGNWSRSDGTRDDPMTSPSDGYGTGLVTYVLLKTGMPPQDPVVVRAIEWLKTHQRVSGRWFTPSLTYDDGVNIMTNAGTIYALMALNTSGAIGKSEDVPYSSTVQQRSSVLQHRCRVRCHANRCIDSRQREEYFATRRVS